MPRARISTTLGLLVLICALAWMWMAYDARNATSSTSAMAGIEAVGMSDAPPEPPSADAMLAERLVDRLDRIDARLAALEAGRRSSGPGAAAEIPPAEADRRLARLLPGDVVDRRQLAQFRIDIAALPQAERFALSTALVRAMNQDRIRIAP